MPGGLTKAVKGGGSLAVAAIAGAIAAAIVARLGQRPNTVANTPPPAPEPPATVVVPSERDPAVAALERRVHLLESSRVDAGKPADVPPPEPAPSTFLVQAQADHQRLDSALRDRFDTEAKDPAWAGEAAGRIRGKLDEIATLSTFKISDVACKTTMCAASVSWPSYNDAHKEYGRLLGLYRIPCATEIFLGESDHPEQAYQATLMMDCEKWRTETP